MLFIAKVRSNTTETSPMRTCQIDADSAAQAKGMLESQGYIVEEVTHATPLPPKPPILSKQACQRLALGGICLGVIAAGWLAYDGYRNEGISKAKTLLSDDSCPAKDRLSNPNVVAWKTDPEVKTQWDALLASYRSHVGKEAIDRKAPETPEAMMVEKSWFDGKLNDPFLQEDRALQGALMEKQKNNESEYCRARAFHVLSDESRLEQSRLADPSVVPWREDPKVKPKWDSLLIAYRNRIAKELNEHGIPETREAQAKDTDWFDAQLGDPLLSKDDVLHQKLLEKQRLNAHEYMIATVLKVLSDASRAERDRLTDPSALSWYADPRVKPLYDALWTSYRVHMVNAAEGLRSPETTKEFTDQDAFLAALASDPLMVRDDAAMSKIKARQEKNRNDVVGHRRALVSDCTTLFIQQPASSQEWDTRLAFWKNALDSPVIDDAGACTIKCFQARDYADIRTIEREAYRAVETRRWGEQYPSDIVKTVNAMTEACQKYRDAPIPTAWKKMAKETNRWLAWVDDMGAVKKRQITVRSFQALGGDFIHNGNVFATPDVTIRVNNQIVGRLVGIGTNAHWIGETVEVEASWATAIPLSVVITKDGSGSASSDAYLLDMITGDKNCLTNTAFLSLSYPNSVPPQPAPYK